MTAHQQRQTSRSNSITIKPVKTRPQRLQLRLTLAASLIGVSALALPAWAQSTPVSATKIASDSSADPSVSEVVVTAEKRASTVQKTPISLTVVTGAELQARGITDLTTLAQEVPGVSFKTSGPGQTEFEIRGLTSTGGESPTVGFYLDDTPLTPPAMAQNGKVVIDPSLYDLARVEILRGPQGTLYGAGSMGGTIKLVTNQPDLNHFQASAESIDSGTDGGGFNHTENVMLNAPILPGQAALRVVATDKYIDGWIAREVLSPFPLETNNGNYRGNVAAAPVAQKYDDSNWERLQGVRAELALQPNDNLTITPSVLYQKINQGAPNTIDSPPGAEAHYQPFNVAEPFSDAFTLGALNINYEAPGFTVTSATADWSRQQFQTQDISEAMQDYIGGFFGPPQNFPFSTAAGGLGAGSISEYDKTNQISEELRVNSKGEGPFQWLIGAYYSSFNAKSHVYSYYDGFTAIFGTNNLADNHRLLDLSQDAVFGEASYKITSELKATVGLRYFNYQSNSVTSVSGVSANGTSAPLYSNASNSGVTPKFDLSYSPTNAMMIYATAAEGFRPGGPNSPIPSSCDAALGTLGLKAAPTQFGPDSVWSYELGEKAKFFQQRLTVDADVYYEDWSGVQQQVAPACGFKFTANAGRATIYGAELETSLKLTSELTLSENAGYTHAVNSTTEVGAGVTAGERLLDVPDYTSNTSLVYTHRLNDIYRLTGRVTNSYVGSMQDITYARNTLPSYDIVDLRAGLSTQKWSAYVFVSNATNTRALLSDTGALSANVETFNRVTTNQPRSYGVDLSYKF
jgi:outer membrane receptor protein involved in Fe transport